MKIKKLQPLPTMTDQDLRWIICRLLSEWEKHPQALNPLLERSLRQAKKEYNQIQRTLATSLTAGVIRWRLRLDHYLEQLQNQKKKLNSELKNILRLALYELDFPSASPHPQMRPAYAVVSEAVNLARLVTPGREGFVNGILRTFLRRDLKTMLPADNDDPNNLSILHSLPVWLVQHWQKDFSEQQVKTLCRQANQFTGTSFRVNRLKISRDELRENLEREPGDTLRLTFGRFAENAFHTAETAALLDSEWLKKGYLSVQDEGAQLISELLNPQPGEIILDACAAPGGKTAHLAELSHNLSTIIAADKNPERLKLISENSKRLELSAIKTVCLDLTEPLPAELPQSYDAILVDAPCSGLGVIRRRADLRWRKNPADIPTLGKIQLQILQNCSRYLKAGGRLLYATCTTSREENQAVVQRFLAENSNFSQISREKITPKRLQAVINQESFLETSFIEDSTMDGFFAAIMTRTI
ncbi:MAG: 16S rRNA (cytosine(967)-C(5))-methyltransferase RsmB [Deltaproteobacteria bacterium]|nr:16S rRNA (cytosine(967)-C(5))-methyltransferase RsmB [Deltaproteobacteria bacterium]